MFWLVLCVVLLLVAASLIRPDSFLSIVAIMVAAVIVLIFFGVGDKVVTEKRQDFTISRGQTFFSISIDDQSYFYDVPYEALKEFDTVYIKKTFNRVGFLLESKLYF